MTRKTMAVAALAMAGGLLAGGTVMAVADAPAEACDSSYTVPMDSTQKMKQYDDCRFDRLEKKLDAMTSAPPTASPSPSATRTPTPTVTPSPTVTATPTPTPTPAPVCAYKPAVGNTGASGTRASSSITEARTNGQVIENVNLPGDLVVTASDVAIRNVQVAGKILVIGDRVTVHRSTAKSLGVSSASVVRVQFSRFTNSQDDGLHVTSDRGKLIRDVVLHGNLIDNPQPPTDAHYDGLQVRGVDGLTVSCNSFDAGAIKEQYNAAVFLEPANGNNSNVSVRDNWLIGSAWSVMVFRPTSSEFVRNQVSGSVRWGSCHSDGLTAANYKQAGNTLNGAPLVLCKV
jgi:hypothetical protein